MLMTLLVHILAGGVGLIAGYIALYTAKGGSLHRRSGMVFVYAMLVMAVFGATITVVRNVAPAINIPAATLTTYLMVTALTTVRPAPRHWRWLHIAALLVALVVGVSSLSFGLEAIANGGKRNDMPSFPFFLFGVIGMLGVAGDVRMLQSGAPRGLPRIRRHLWRMCVALFIAALSFSVQLAKFIPRPVRPVVLIVPMLAVVATLFYWLWRVRARRKAGKKDGGPDFHPFVLAVPDI